MTKTPIPNAHTLTLKFHRFLTEAEWRAVVEARAPTLASYGWSLTDKILSMSLRLGALHDALINAGTEPELARRAAEEVAAYERHLSDVRTDLLVLKWMAGANFAAVLAVLARVYFP